MAFAGMGWRIAAGAGGKLTIGVTDWNLKLAANPDALPLGKRLGFDGVQVSFGRRIVDGKMPLDNPQTISRYRSVSDENQFPIDGTCVDRLHDNGLKNDKQAIQWVLDAIRLTGALRKRVRWRLQSVGVAAQQCDELLQDLDVRTINVDVAGKLKQAGNSKQESTAGSF